MNIYNRGQPLYFIQTPKQVVIINELYAPPGVSTWMCRTPTHPTPSWYGELVGHDEGDSWSSTPSG